MTNPLLLLLFKMALHHLLIERDQLFLIHQVLLIQQNYTLTNLNGEIPFWSSTVNCLKSMQLVRIVLTQFWFKSNTWLCQKKNGIAIEVRILTTIYKSVNLLVFYMFYLSIERMLQMKLIYRQALQKSRVRMKNVCPEVEGNLTLLQLV